MKYILYSLFILLLVFLTYRCFFLLLKNNHYLLSYGQEIKQGRVEVIKAAKKNITHRSFYYEVYLEGKEATPNFQFDTEVASVDYFYEAPKLWEVVSPYVGKLVTIKWVEHSILKENIVVEVEGQKDFGTSDFSYWVFLFLLVMGLLIFSYNGISYFMR